MRNFQMRRTAKTMCRTELPMLKRNQSCRGQALLEFSLVAMLFFLLAFAAIDFCWLLFNQMSMQNAVRAACRYASTGDYITSPTTGTSIGRVNSITQILQQAAVGTNIQSIVISSVAGGTCNSSGLPLGCAGGPGDTVTVKAVCGVPLLTNVFGSFFTGDTFNFTVSATFKDEPFPSAQTN